MKEEILKEFREKFHYDEEYGFYTEPLGNSVSHKPIEDFWLSKLVEEYKRGYNECLKEQGKVGEKYQHLYL